MKALNTLHNGYNFRSILEARWAVYFEETCIEYLYEPGKFQLSDGSVYIPDFYLPKFNTWVEVKFEPLQYFDFNRATLLVKSSKRPLLILDADPSLKFFTLIAPSDEEPGYETLNINVVEDEENTNNFLKGKFLLGEEAFYDEGYEEAIEAVATARAKRFGIFEKEPDGELG